MVASKSRLLLVLLFLFLYVPFVTNFGFKAADKENMDLPSFYYAADVAFNDQASPYTVEARNLAQRELGQRVFPFLYPPPSLLFFAPFSWMSYPTTKLVALIGNHLCLLALMYLLLFRIFKIPLLHRNQEPNENSLVKWLIGPVLIIYILNFNPLAITLNHGQINLVVMVLLCLFWLGLREDRHPILVALPLALAIALKTYPILFLPVLLIHRQFRTTAWTGGFLSVLVGLSLMIVPGQAWTDWLNLVLPSGGYANTPHQLFSPAMPWNQSLNGFTARLFLHPRYAFSLSPLLARVVPYLLAVIVVGTMIRLTMRQVKLHKTRFTDDEFAMVLLSIFLIAPLSWEHHLVFVLPAALLALLYMLDGKVSLKATIATGLAIFVMAWPLSYLATIQGQTLLTLLVSAKFFATTGLWVFFLLRQSRQPQPAASVWTLFKRRKAIAA